MIAKEPAALKPGDHHGHDPPGPLPYNMVFLQMVHRESQHRLPSDRSAREAGVSGVVRPGCRAGDGQQAQPLDLWEHGSLGNRAQRGGFIGHDRA